jgi:hypothetical protein
MMAAAFGGGQVGKPCDSPWRRRTPGDLPLRSLELIDSRLREPQASAGHLPRRNRYPPVLFKTSGALQVNLEHESGRVEASVGQRGLRT